MNSFDCSKHKRSLDMALLMLTMMIKPCMRDGQPAYSQRPHHPQFTKLDTVWVCSKHTAVHMKHNVLCTKHSADMNETQGGVSQVGERSPTHVPRPTITPREMEEQALLNWAHTRITTITLSYQYETQSNALSYHFLYIQNTMHYVGVTKHNVTLKNMVHTARSQEQHCYQIILFERHNYHIILFD